MPLAVVEYLREDGSNPYRSWFDSLDPQAAAKIATAVLRLHMGNTSRVKWIGALGEYRIDWGPGYRIYLAQDGETLFGGIQRGGNKVTFDGRRRSFPSTGRARPLCPDQDAKGDGDAADEGFQANHSGARATRAGVCQGVV